MKSYKLPLRPSLIKDELWLDIPISLTVFDTEKEVIKHYEEEYSDILMAHTGSLKNLEAFCLHDAEGIGHIEIVCACNISHEILIHEAFHATLAYARLNRSMVDDFVWKELQKEMCIEDVDQRSITAEERLASLCGAITCECMISLTEYKLETEKRSNV